MPIDPVCGIELDKKIAVLYEHNDGSTYYFCCDGCKQIFIKKSRKWIKKLNWKRSTH